MCMENTDLLDAHQRLTEDYDELWERYGNKKERFVLQLKEKDDMYEVMGKEMKMMKGKENKMKNMIKRYKTKLKENKREIRDVTTKYKEKIKRIHKKHLEYLANLKKTYQGREEKLLT